MTEKFRNKYRVSTARMQTWDYATHAAYYITICTKGRVHYFGEIVHQDLDVLPKIPVNSNQPSNTPPIQSNSPSIDKPIDESPNNIHGEPGQLCMQLSELGKIAESEWLKTPDLRPDMNLILDKYVVMPDHFHAIIIIGPNNYNRGGDKPVGGVFGPQRKNLGSVVRGFKSAVTTYAQKNNLNFGWQERFHDRIIRDDQEFARIAHYIETNPADWMDGNKSDGNG